MIVEVDEEQLTEPMIQVRRVLPEVVKMFKSFCFFYNSSGWIPWAAYGKPGHTKLWDGTNIENQLGWQRATFHPRLELDF